MRSRRSRLCKGRLIHGWLGLDKPPGCTSNKALTEVKRLLDARKAGYAGTLDPIACGVLPIALGEATKTVEFINDSVKCYRFQLRWGEATNTDDRAGEVIQVSPHRPDRDEIEALLPRFSGNIELVPPQFSAIKVNGIRAYTKARQGIEVKLAPRPVRIDHFSLIESPDRDRAIFTVTCGRGTYMRSLARELALALGTCAHITDLRRERVGPFTSDNSVTMNRLEECAREGNIDELLRPIEQVVEDVPTVELDPQEAASIRHGRAVTLHKQIPLSTADAPRIGSNWLLACAQGQPVALVQIQGMLLQPRKVFNVAGSYPGGYPGGSYPG